MIEAFVNRISWQESFNCPFLQIGNHTFSSLGTKVHFALPKVGRLLAWHPDFRETPLWIFYNFTMLTSFWQFENCGQVKKLVTFETMLGAMMLISSEFEGGRGGACSAAGGSAVELKRRAGGGGEENWGERQWVCNLQGVTTSNRSTRATSKGSPPPPPTPKPLSASKDIFAPLWWKKQIKRLQIRRVVN